MARIAEKCRLCRREGTKLFLKGERCFSPKCPLEKKGPVIPGMHGLKGSRRQSGYGRQLREKQKIKRIYGISETQCKNYFQKARRSKGIVGTTFLLLLETRLDNIVYRLGFAPSRTTARQLIAHGYIQVNQKKVTSSSFSLKTNDEVLLKEKARKMSKIETWMAKKDFELPEWLKREGFIGKVVKLPERKDVSLDVNESLIIEFYSR